MTRPAPQEAERVVAERTAHLDLDHRAMAVVSNVFRVSTAIRRHMESHVLAPDRLSWTAFVALWCLWVWGEMESRDLAAAVGISKPTGTGVVTTLERRGLVRRRRSRDDRRMVRVALTARGRRTIESLFPRFNAEESALAASMTARQQDTLAELLRALLRRVPE
jgi:MarR family transcriptional regulator, organic hydroperoxide resistance regulator